MSLQGKQIILCTIIVIISSLLKSYVFIKAFLYHLLFNSERNISISSSSSSNRNDVQGIVQEFQDERERMWQIIILTKRLQVTDCRDLSPVSIYHNSSSPVIALEIRHRKGICINDYRVTIYRETEMYSSIYMLVKIQMFIILYHYNSIY